jgi:hypothetical protein
MRIALCRLYPYTCGIEQVGEMTQKEVRVSRTFPSI